jgi:hypothetical protein
MKPKYRTCRYNTARNVHEFFNVHCVWALMMSKTLTLPPHVYFSEKYMNERTCSKCKCYEKVENE